MKTTWSGALLVVALALTAAPARAQDPFDAIHLAVPEIPVARDWYLQHIGGNVGETPDQVAFGKWPGDHPLPIQLIFHVSRTAQPSAGSVLDRIGFSYPNVEQKVAELRAAGVKVVQPVTTTGLPWKHAIVEDPWGTRLELVEDPDLLGLHHVMLGVPDPPQMLSWLVRAFGGDRATVMGLDVIRIRELGLFYVIAEKNDHPTPSQGHVIDHIAWGPIDLDKMVNNLKSMEVTFASNPNPRGFPACNFVGGEGAATVGVRRLYCSQPDQLPHRVVFLDAPNGLRVELLQHLEAGGH